MTEARELTARVISQHRGGYVLHTDDGDLAATLAGRLRHEARPDELPAVGDSVLASSAAPGSAIIQTVLPRRNAVRRGETGINDAQILAANPGPVAQIRDGKESLKGFLVGQILKAGQGRLDARLVNEVLAEALAKG